MHVLYTPIVVEASLLNLPRYVVEELQRVYFEENGSKDPESLADLLEVVL